ncbi:4-oxalocrotonate tautomerase family protein [Burkholderia sp. Bp9143]|uniref:tautomerase family protein n=1 Tax=Burkholderia sp. Bp9143 TaxID=2184574 RepID=UPI000F5B78FD|nr:4-oxalocrotonate tautomerase family protein [Burkholderia sp. Bp9143]RQR35502.1 4-oxalocrotonate tautomerase family protein [Burkholderia sp. Bp9143]
MPVVRVSWLAGKEASAKKAVAADITESLLRHAGIEPRHTFVIFEDVPASDWAIAGELCAEPSRPA